MASAPLRRPGHSPGRRRGEKRRVPNSIELRKTKRDQRGYETGNLVSLRFAKPTISPLSPQRLSRNSVFRRMALLPAASRRPKTPIKQGTLVTRKDLETVRGRHPNPNFGTASQAKCAARGENTVWPSEPFPTFGRMLWLPPFKAYPQIRLGARTVGLILAPKTPVDGGIGQGGRHFEIIS